MIDFVIGAALADLFVTNENSWRRSLGLLPARGVLALAFFLVPWKPVAATMIVAAVAASPRLQWILSARWLAWLGRISFGLYLIHMPILCAVACSLFVWLCRDLGWSYGSAALLASAVGITAVVAASWLFSVAVDGPAIALPRWLEDKLFRPKPEAPAAVILRLPPVSKAA